MGCLRVLLPARCLSNTGAFLRLHPPSSTSLTLSCLTYHLFFLTRHFFCLLLQHLFPAQVILGLPKKPQVSLKSTSDVHSTSFILCDPSTPLPPTLPAAGCLRLGFSYWFYFLNDIVLFSPPRGQGNSIKQNNLKLSDTV